MPLEPKTASVARVLFQMMGTKTLKYPSRKELNAALEEAYDASLNTSVSLLYDQIEMKIQMRFVDPNLLGDAAYETQLIKILKDVLHHPYLDETLLNQEKSFILDDIKTKESQKSHIASSMLTDTLLKGHPYHVPSTEEAPLIKAVQLNEVLALFEKLKDAPCLILAAGPFPLASLKRWLKVLDLKGHPSYQPHPLLKTPIAKKEPLSVQSKMHQVYRYHVYDSGVYRDDVTYPTFIVLQHILGGDSDSILFKRIRETHSMAYSVQAIPSIKYGLLIIQGSIDPAKTDLYDQEIGSILQELKEQKVDKDTLFYAQQSITETIKRNSDSISVLSRRALMHYYFNEPFEMDAYLAQIKAVTADDIQRLAQKLKEVYAFKYGGFDA
jgi:predicted Zn-dependent peptidase